MTVELIQTLSYVAFGIAGLLLLVSIALFFLFDVPKLIGDVSGATAKKAIENIRQQNEQTGNKAFKPSPVNAERGKLTDKITPSGRLEHRGGNMGVSVGTQELKDVHNDNFGNSSQNEESVTELLYSSDAAAETSILDFGNNVFDNNMYQKDIGVIVEYELRFCGSSEIIS